MTAATSKAFPNDANDDDIILPTEGPLGMARGGGYHPTNEDLLQNTYLQNRAINQLTRTMRYHSTVIEDVNAIRKYMKFFVRLIVWGIPILGGTGLLAIYNWLGNHWH